MGFKGEVLAHMKRLVIIQRRDSNILVFQVFQVIFFSLFFFVVLCLLNYKAERGNSEKHGMDSVKQMSLWYFPKNPEFMTIMDNIRQRMEENNSRRVSLQVFELEKNVKDKLKKGVMSKKRDTLVVEIHKLKGTNVITFTFRKIKDYDNRNKLTRWDRMAALFLKSVYNKVLEENFPGLNVNIEFSGVDIPFLPWEELVLRHMVFFMSVSHGLVLMWFLEQERTNHLDEAIVMLGGSHRAYISSWYLQATLQSSTFSLLYGISFYIIMMGLSTPLAFWELPISFFIFSNFVAVTVITTCLIIRNVKISLVVFIVYHASLYGVVVAHAMFDNGATYFFVPHMVIRCPCPGLLGGPDSGVSGHCVFTCYGYQMICYLIFLVCGFCISLKYKLLKKLAKLFPGLFYSTMQWREVHERRWFVKDELYQQEYLFMICRNRNAKEESFLPENYKFHIPFMQTTVLLDPLGTGMTSLFRNIIGRECPASERVLVDRKLRSSVCMCPSYDFLCSNLTVMETLVIFSKFLYQPKEVKMWKKKKSKKSEISNWKTAAKDFNLMGKINKLVKNLSESERKLLMMAIMFLSSAKIVILDEPFGPLSDDSLKVAIWNVQKHKHTKTILMSCSSGEDAIRVADRVAVILDNRIKIYGTVFFVMESLGIGTHIRMIKTQTALSGLYTYLWMFAPNMKCLNKLNYDFEPNMSCLNFYISRVNVSFVQFVVSNLRNKNKTFGLEELKVSDTAIDQVLERCKHPKLLEAVLLVHSSTTLLNHNIKVTQFKKVQHWMSQEDNSIRYSNVNLYSKPPKTPSLSASSMSLKKMPSNITRSIATSEMSLTDFLKSSRHFHIAKGSNLPQSQNNNSLIYPGQFGVSKHMLEVDLINKFKGKRKQSTEYDQDRENNVMSNLWFLCSPKSTLCNISKIVHLPNKITQNEKKSTSESNWPNKNLYSKCLHSYQYQIIGSNFCENNMAPCVILEIENDPNSNINNNGLDDDANVGRYYNMVMDGVLKEDNLSMSRQSLRRQSVALTDKNILLRHEDESVNINRQSDQFINHTQGILAMTIQQHWSSLLFIILGLLTTLIAVNVVVFLTSDHIHVFIKQFKRNDLKGSLKRKADFYAQQFSNNDSNQMPELQRLYDYRVKDFAQYSPSDMSGIPQDLNIISIGASFQWEEVSNLTAKLYYTHGQGDALMLSIITAMESIKELQSKKRRGETTVNFPININPLPLLTEERSRYILNRTQPLSAKIAIVLGIASCVLVFSIVLGSSNIQVEQFHQLLVFSGVSPIALNGIELLIQALLYLILMLIVLLSLLIHSLVREVFYQNSLPVVILMFFLLFYVVAVFSLVNVIKRIFNWEMTLYIWLGFEGLAIGLLIVVMTFAFSSCHLSSLGTALVIIVNILSPVSCQTYSFYYLLQHDFWQLVRSHLPNAEIEEFPPVTCLMSIGYKIAWSLLSHFVQIVFFSLIYIFLQHGLCHRKREKAMWTDRSSSKNKGLKMMKGSLKITDVNLVDGFALSTSKKSFKTVTATVNANQCLIVFGNGPASMITHLIRLIIGLDDLKQGTIKFEGKHLPKRQCWSSKEHMEIGYCPLENTLDPRLTGRQVLRLFAYIRNVPSYDNPNYLRETVNNILRIIPLTDVADCRISTYSDDDKRKLQIAMALIGSPKFLILDHPTVGLDLLMKIQIWTVINDYRNNGSTIVVSTDCAEEGLFLGTSLEILYKGSPHIEMNIESVKDKTTGFLAYLWLQRDSTGTSVPILSVIRQVQLRFRSGVFAIVSDVRDPYIIFSFVNASPDLDHARIYDVLDELKESETIRNFIVKESTEINILDSLKYNWLPF